jgi:hypothetical protein
MKNVINIGKVCRVASENEKPISVLELCDMFYHNIHNMLGLALSKALLGDKVAKKAYDAGVEALKGIGTIRDFYASKGNRPTTSAEKKIMTEVLEVVRKDHNYMLRIMG